MLVQGKCVKIPIGGWFVSYDFHLIEVISRKISGKAKEPELKMERYYIKKQGSVISPNLVSYNLINIILNGIFLSNSRNYNISICKLIKFIFKVL